MTPSKEKLWLKYYPKGAKDIAFRECTMYQLMKEMAETIPGLTAINYVGAKITNKYLLEKIDLYAKGLVSLGVKADDVVSVVTTNVPEAVYFLYALNKIGACCNMIDPRIDVYRMQQMFEETNTKIAVSLDLALEKVDRFADLVGLEKLIVCSPAKSLSGLKKIAYSVKKGYPKSKSKNAITCKQFESLAKEAKDVEAVSYKEDRDCLIVYTGGTTGLSKGVVLNNDNINSIVHDFRYAGAEYNKGDKFMSVIPIFSSYGCIASIHMPLCLGVQISLNPVFNVKKVAERFFEYKPNHMLAVPTCYEAILNHPKANNANLSFLRTAGTGGDTVNPVLEGKINEYLLSHGAKYPLAQGYGMTEASSAVSWCFQNYCRQGSVGVPALLADVGVFDPDTEQELGYNETGEICISGIQVMQGFYGKPEETNKVIRKHKDGSIWLHSGDLGYMDDEGFLYIKSRIKYMIIRHTGHKDYPIQYEHVVQQHPDVRLVGVIPVKDKRHIQGDLPLVMVASDVPDKDRLHDELSKLLFERIPEGNWPAGVVVLDDLPLTPVGKVDVNKLKEEYKDYDYENKDLN